MSAEKYYDANSTEDLLAALIDITSAGGKTLNNASLIDKLSSNVSLTSNDVETSYYKLPEVQTNLSDYGTPQRWTNQTPSVQTQPLEEGGFQFSNITLGQGEMVRLKYQIKLKSDAQNGEFQTVSQETYLMNGPTTDTNKKMYLPVPSIRYLNQERDIVVKKQDIFGNPIPGVTFELSKVKRQVEGSSQTSANGEAGFAFDFPSNGKSSPKYQIQETKAPNQYQKLSGSLTFQVSKSSGKFSLTNETSGSKTLYNDLPNWWNKAGSKTDTWPFGYSGSNHVFSITQTKKNNNPPTVHLTVKNQFKPLEISVLKVDGDKPLPNAKFQLREAGKDGKFTRVLGEGVSNDAGVVTFYRSSTGEKKPLTLEISTESKKYRIYETQAPENYEDPSEDDYWEIEVNPATQNITYHRNGEEQSQVETQFEKIATEAGQTLPLQLKIENQQQAADLVIVKKQGEQILNGVSFELSRNETGFTSNKSTYKAYSGLQGVKESSGLSWSEAGAGNFFQALNGDKYQDLDFSAPFVLEKGQYTLTEEETLVGYLKNQKDWQIEVEESGEVILAEDSSGAKIEKTEISGKLTWVVSVENQLLPIDLTVKKNDRYNSEKMLSGAEFTATKKENGKWLEPDNLIEVEDSGNYQLAKLELGTYKIEETTAPSGYQRLSGYFELEIRQADANFIDASGKLIEKGSLMAEVQYYLDSQPSGEKETVSLKEEKGKLQIEFTVSNNPYNPLPATGGIGRLGQFLIAAGLLTASLFVGWLTKRLKGREAGLHD
ncbi:SpaA isopeptide-forming pilin-related protein [Enterococcus sp. LJL120]